MQRSFVQPHNGTEVLTTAGVVATLTGISRTSSNPERAMMFLELLNTDVEVYNLMCKGVEGKHWVWKDEARKIVGFPEGVTAETSAYNPNTDWMFGNQFNAYFVSEEQANANVWEETAKLNTRPRRRSRSASPSTRIRSRPSWLSSPRSAKSKASWLPTARTSVRGAAGTDRSAQGRRRRESAGRGSTPARRVGKNERELSGSKVEGSPEA